MELCVWLGQPLRCQPGHRSTVQLFGQIVTQLICRIDPSLNVCKRCVARSRRARLVLNVPQIEVGSVLPLDKRKK